MPVDDELLIITVICPAGLHNFLRMLVTRRPEIRSYLARWSTERPWMLLSTEQRNVGIVVEHQQIWSPTDLDRKFRVQTKIHYQPEQRGPAVPWTKSRGRPVHLVVHRPHRGAVD